MEIFSGLAFNIIKILAVIGFVFITLVYRHKPYQALGYFLIDLKNRDPEHFTEYGVQFYVNSMGSGKTISLTERAIKLRERYPKLLIVSNFEISVADQYFTAYEELLDLRNPYGSEYGVLILFDEVHLTFASDKWKHAPEGLLDYIAMRRKERTLILGTSQVFGRIDKKLREQATVVIECNTILNRWTFNNAFKIEEYLVNDDLKDSGTRKRKRLWKYNFIQTNKIRNSYDSYALVEKLDIDLRPKERKYLDLSKIGNDDNLEI